MPGGSSRAGRTRTHRSTPTAFCPGLRPLRSEVPERLGLPRAFLDRHGATRDALEHSRPMSAPSLSDRTQHAIEALEELQTTARRANGQAPNEVLLPIELATTNGLSWLGQALSALRSNGEDER